MIPNAALGAGGVGGAPRVCGDDPPALAGGEGQPEVLPAYAGMIRLGRDRPNSVIRAPRVCGDDPNIGGGAI